MSEADGGSSFPALPGRVCHLLLNPFVKARAMAVDPPTDSSRTFLGGEGRRVSRARVEVLRESLGWTQDELAQAAGITARSLRRALSGASVSQHTVRGLERALGVPRADFMSIAPGALGSVAPVRCAEFCCREDELAGLAALARAPEPQRVCVVAPSGMGKSALLRELAAVLEAADYLVLWATIGAGVAGATGYLVPWLEQLGETDPPRTVAAICNAIRARVKQRPVVAILDDIYDTVLPSEIDTVLRAVQDACAVVASSRDGAMPRRLSMERRMLAPWTLGQSRIALARYARCSVGEIPRDLLGSLPECRGCPMLVRLLATRQNEGRDLALDRFVADSIGEAKSSLGVAVAHRVAEMEGAARQVLQAATCFRGGILRPSYVGNAASLSGVDVLGALEELRRAGLVEWSGGSYFSFHPLVLSFVRSRMPDSEGVRRGHARVVSDLTADIVRRVQEADTIGDPAGFRRLLSEYVALHPEVMAVVHEAGGGCDGELLSIGRVLCYESHLVGKCGFAQDAHCLSFAASEAAVRLGDVRLSSLLCSYSATALVAMNETESARRLHRQACRHGFRHVPVDDRVRLVVRRTLADLPFTGARPARRRMSLLTGVAPRDLAWMPRVMLLSCRALIEIKGSQWDAAEAACRDVLRECQGATISSLRERTRHLSNLANVLGELGRRGEARLLLEEALTCARRLASLDLEALVSWNLGHLIYKSDPKTAWALMGTRLRRLEEIGDPALEAARVYVDKLLVDGPPQ